MDTLRTAVITACGAGIISSIIGSVAVGKSKKAIIKLMINCIAIISLIRPFTSFDTGDAANLIDNYVPQHMSAEEAEKELMAYNVRAAELSLKIELEKLLKDNRIDYSEVVIKCEYGEYDEITVSSAEVTVKAESDLIRLNELSALQMKDLPLKVRTADT